MWKLCRSHCLHLPIRKIHKTVEIIQRISLDKSIDGDVLMNNERLHGNVSWNVLFCKCSICKRKMNDQNKCIVLFVHQIEQHFSNSYIIIYKLCATAQVSLRYICSFIYFLHLFLKQRIMIVRLLVWHTEKKLLFGILIHPYEWIQYDEQLHFECTSQLFFHFLLHFSLRFRKHSEIMFGDFNAKLYISNSFI